jgi:hypothetical protein
MFTMPPKVKPQLCCLQASAGLTYSFSLYAPTVKDSLDLTQTQIATVGSAINSELLQSYVQLHVVACTCFGSLGLRTAAVP